HPPVRLFETEQLGGPHLVLADFGGDIDVPVLGQGVQAFDGVLRLDDGVGGRIGEAVAGAPAVDLAPPVLQRRGVGLQLPPTPHLQHVGEHAGAVADDADIGAHDLV